MAPVRTAQEAAARFIIDGPVADLNRPMGGRTGILVEWSG